MKLIRFGEKGIEKPGLLREDRIVDLTAIFPDIPDIGAAFFRECWMNRIKGIDSPGEVLNTRIGCPIARPEKIICLGKNYGEHARETGMDLPTRPLLFNKTINTLNGPFDPILHPKSCTQIDWEVELAVVIGREGKRISPEEALNYIAGFTVINDVSGREAQFADGQWFRGKSFDTFAPVGPALVTLDEIGTLADLKNLQLTTYVNGVQMQNGNTRDMIFSVPEIIAYISEDITLVPGDIIATGTPSGVGFFRDPPIVLQAGDVVRCAVEKIGWIENRVIDGS
jgi:2,4-didehydro-3-deoxy-L-rhamnonate hydrolase